MTKALYLTSNMLQGAGVTVTPTSEAAEFPKERLFDARSSRAFRFNAAAADLEIKWDLGSALAWDFVSVHGHAFIDSGITAIQVRSSTDNFSASDNLEFTIALPDATAPTFYGRDATGITRRYGKIVFVGTPSAAIALGELYVGQATEIARNPNDDGIVLSARMPRLAATTPAGELYVTNLSDFESRLQTLRFRGLKSDMEEVRKQLWIGSGHGRDPVVFVLDPAEPEAILCKLAGEFRYEFVIFEEWEYQLELQELPFFLTL